MPIRTPTLIVLLFILVSCSDNKKSEQNTSDKIAVDTPLQSLQLTKSDILTDGNNANSDSVEVHIFKSGETLWDLCTRYYGNRHYSSILSIYNKIQDVNRIEPEAEIKIPPLTAILTDKDFGLVPPLEKEVLKILAARQLYVEVEGILWETRRATNWKGKQNLTEIVVINLERAAGLIDLTIIQLNKPKENTTTTPTKMIDNLKSVSRNLKHLASGANDGYGYDLDMIHQDLIRTIHNGRAWVNQNYSKLQMMGDE